MIEIRQDDYELLVSSIEDYAIFMLDPSGRVATWNSGAQKIKGYRAEEILGKHFSIFYPAGEIVAARPEYDLEVAERVGHFEDEGWRVRKDGTLFWANIGITALWTKGGTLRGFAKVTRDLTERKQAEETEHRLVREQAARAAAQTAAAQIRESEELHRELSERLDVILQGVADGITVQDRSSQVTFANSAALRLFGFLSPEQLMAPTASDQFFATYELLDELGEPLPVESLPGPRALAGELPEPMLVCIRHRKTGRALWSNVRASAVHDMDGAPALAINIWHDVTTERRQQEAVRYLAKAAVVLSESIEKDRTLQALAGVLVPDLADWCVIHLDEGNGSLRAVATAHKDPAQLIAAEEYERRWPTRADAARGAPRVIRTGASELYAEIDDSMLAEVAEDEEHLQLLRDTEMRSVVSVPLGVEGKVFGAMTLISTQHHHRYDTQDLSLIEELGRRAGIAIEHARLYEDAQKAIQKRDDFLSVASHELRTPLTSLQLHLSALLDAAERGRLYDMPLEKIAQRLGKSLEQAHRLTTLIDELLDVSRIGGGRLGLARQSVDLGQLVREVSARFEQDARRTGSKIVLRARPVVGHWDRGRVDQIVTNLLSNALKYGGGKSIEVSVEKHDGTACLIVRDHGIGIRTTDQGRIFERFERTHDARNFGGLGLGLWIVRELAAGHGGKVTVESEVDLGARFVVELPIDQNGGDGVEYRDGGG